MEGGIMADIKLSSLGSAISFTVVTSLGGSKTAEFATEFPAGVYTIYSIAGDTDLEIYLGAADGSNVGFSTNGNKAIIATAPFKYVTTANANSFDAIVFEQYEVSSEAATLVTKTDAFWAPPTITAISPASLFNQNATTTITGTNFSTNSAVQFRKSDDSTLVSAKAIVVGSSTSIIATRPDSFSPTDAPYDVIITNPTTGLSSISLNSITAGSAPVWSTAATLSAFQKTVAYSQSVIATDADLSPTITYSQISATLPTGVTFNNGTFSGTPSTNVGSYSAVIRATDLGGNYADRTFTLAQDKPDAPGIGVATSTGATTATVAFTAPTYAGTSSITSYRVVSSPAGGSGTLSQSNSGTINVTGLSDATTYTFTVIATNSSGDSLSSSASSSITTQNPSISLQYTIIGGGGCGITSGGGAGGMLDGTNANFSLGTYTATIGAGGIAGDSNTGSKGTNSVFGSLIAYAGGIGTSTPNNAGGSGSGAYQVGVVGIGIAGQGYDGGQGTNITGARGGGGGAGGVGTQNNGGNGGAGRASSINGVLYAGGGAGGRGDQSGNSAGSTSAGGGSGGGWGYQASAIATNATNYGSGGGGQGYAQDAGYRGGHGYQGLIILKYPDTKTLTSSGMTLSTTSAGGFKTTTITAGNGTVTLA
jgi:hypothetical protein